MTHIRSTLIVTVLLSLAGIVPAASAQPDSTNPHKPDDVKTERAQATADQAPAKQDQPAAPKIPDRATLEKQFEEMLSGAVFQGVWQVTTEGGLKGTAAMSEPRTESYAIHKTFKMNDDTWVIQARIQFAEKDVTIPVPVRVVWAGDTPVITLDDLSMPLLGTYSARVMVHNGFYSGVWYCNEKNYGGVLSGRILKQADLDAAAKPDQKPSSPQRQGDTEKKNRD